MKRIMALGAVLLLSVGAASADEPGSVYVGAGAGTQDYTVGCFSDACTAGKHRFSGKVYLGYTPTDFQWANPNLVNSFEVVYYEAGALDGSYPSFSGGGAKLRMRGVGLVDSLSYKVDAFSITGRLGVTQTRSTFTYSVAGSTFARVSDKVGAIAGVGVAYDLSKRWTARLDIDNVPVDKRLLNKDSVNMLTVGAGYRF